MIARDRPLLCFVHSAQSDPAESLRAARALAAAGNGAWGAVDLVQVRGKNLAAGDLEALARVWLDALEPHPLTRVVVNDRLDVALAAGADGVHVGRDDLPVAEARRVAPEDFLIGASTHDPREIERAQRSEADYAGLGAFYATRTKAAAELLDLDDPDWLRPVPGITIPVVAIGGITADRVADVLAIPVVTGIAASEAIQCASEPAAAILDLRSALDRAWLARPSGSFPEGS